MAKTKDEEVEKTEEVEVSQVFTVFQGSQPKYSGSHDNAEAYAARLRGDALHQGTNLEVAEHKIEVR